MKLIFFFLVFFLSFQSIKSQAYTKIPEDPNYFWKQSSDCSFRYQIRYYQDTMIRGIKFAKYSLFGATSGTPGCSPSFLYNGYLRQDSLARKVIILDNNFDERPLYNFNKVAGDTLLSYDRVTNTNRTYTVQSTNANQTMQALLQNSFFTTYVVQGIGSLQGGLYGCFVDPSGVQPSDRLICHGKISPYQLISPPDVGFEGMCFLNTALKDEIEEFTSVQVWPNPASEDIHVEIANDKYLPATITIYNSFGVITNRKIIVDKNTIVEIQNFKPGLYLIKFESGRAVRFTKIIKL